jgi:Flp pilus assembly protein TadG
MYSSFRRFAVLSIVRDTQGAVSIMFGLTLVILLGLIGAVLDFGSAMVSRTQAQGGTDAAALAIAQPPGGIDRDVAGKRYFEINYPFATAGVARKYSDLGVDVQADRVTVESRANMDSKLLFVNGPDQVAANAITVVSRDTQPTPPDLDLVLVVDSSRSMICPSGVLSDNTLGNTDVCDGILDPLPYPGPSVPPPSVTNSRYAEQLAATQELVSLIFSVGSPNVRFGLVQFSSNLKQADGLTNVQSQAEGYISNITLDGWTCGACGMQGAINIFSGASPSPATPRADGAPLSKVKQVIFMTDGVQNCAFPGDSSTTYPGTLCGYERYDADGNFISGLSPSDGRPFSDLRERCDQLKSMGVSIATIAYGADVQGSGSNRDSLEYCASPKPDGQPQFYLAPDFSSLRAALQDVTRTVGKMRITK